MSRRASDAKALQALPGVLTDALTEAGFGNVVMLVRLKRSWAEIAGPQLAAVSRPVRFRWGELLVSVDNAIWLHQMTFFQAKLRGNIRSVVGDGKFSRLRFVLAYSTDQSRSPSDAVRSPRQPQMLTEDEDRLVRNSTAGIAHAGLRAAASRAWRHDLLAKR